MLAIARSAAAAILAATRTDVSMLDWLRKHGQTERAIRRFWGVCWSARSTKNLTASTPATASTFSGKRFSRIARLSRGHSPRSARRALRRMPRGHRARGRGSALRAVRGLRVADGRVDGSGNGRRHEETADLLSCSPFRTSVARSCCPRRSSSASRYSRICGICATSPITGVHFWFDRDVMAEPFLTLLDRTTQWIFNKSRLYGGPRRWRAISATGDQRFLRFGCRARARKSSICASRELREVLPERARPSW